jgi:acid phosphatase family membrane protein YuiD
MDLMLFIDFMAINILHTNLFYIFTPFIAWFISGLIKFLINSFKTKKLAFNLIGYGGLPSNHSAIVSSAASLVFFEKGLSDPTICVAVALAFIVFLDANGLRGQIGQQAKLINILNSDKRKRPLLREHIGHTKIEIIAGALLGFIVAAIIYNIS